ncbi:MAG: GNAT family N-acetyltransferase [Treponema sp.]|jgi:predicted N-acyltransferase|nr:GNAT family N-acetyltransferase [Treponema sp.]
MRDIPFSAPCTLRLASSIADFAKDEWNALVTDETIPFLEWEWLAALEESESICPRTGWYPFHLSLWKKEQLLAAAPLYLKNHSDGEFVWDYFWAEAAAGMGRRWYPKLVGTTPATPALGYRFLVLPGENGAELSALLLDAAERLCRANGIRGLHFLFADPAWAREKGSLVERGYAGWEHARFEWLNEYADFDGYLSRFNKNQRKNIRREYQRHNEQGISLDIVENASPAYFRRIHELYAITNDKFIPWDARWVNGDFFLRLGKTFRRRVVFSSARYNGGEEPLALAMMIRKGKKIWGRYWGTGEDVRDLHFACCYYAPIEYCIREGIACFDPGIGSPHKIRRGFRACADTSYHRFFDPALEALFTANIAAVNSHERNSIAALNAELPLKTNTL